MKNKIRKIMSTLLALTMMIPVNALPVTAASETTGDFYGSFVDQDGVGLEGVQLTLKKVDGETVATTLTNSDGEFEMKDIPTGGYVLQLDEAHFEVGTDDAADYSRDGGYLITIAPNQRNTFIKGGTAKMAKRIAGKINIEKVVKGTDTPIEGVVFSLTKTGETLPLVSKTTDSDGKLTFEAVAFGSYDVREVSAPDGYVLSKDTFNVTVSETSYEIELKVENDKECSVSVVKSDSETNAPLAGAVFELYDDKDNKIGEAKTTNQEGKLVYNYLSPGKYYLKEIQAPVGYVLDTQKYEFELTNENIDKIIEIKNVKIEDPKFSVTINKYEPNSTSRVVGAELEIWKGSEKVDSIVTTNEAWIVSLESGDYVLKEISAPDGYLKSSDIEFTVEDENISVNMYDEYTSLIINKYIKGTTTRLAGAKLEIHNENGQKIYEFTTTEEPHVIQRIPVGKYKLVEKEAPEGYLISSPVEFTIEENAKPHSIQMEDDYTKVSIYKYDAVSKDLLEGAKLVLKNELGVEVEKWTSTSDAYLITKLPVGKYTLSEEEAPTGYLVADDVTFEVKAESENQKVEMYDDYTKVSISKQDISTEKELPGAKLVLEDSKGNEVESWVSTNEPHLIEKLPTGKYKLTETTSPDGYVKAESIEFEVKSTGEVQKVVMYDDYTKVNISKQDITTKKELPGAKLKLTTKDGALVAEWTSTTEPYSIERLAPGKYVLIETVAPAGYVKAENVEFEVKLTGEVQKVVMYDDYTKVSISKQDITTKKELPGAKLKLATKDGTLIEEWTSTTEAHTIDKLVPGQYVLTEITAPAGYVKAENVTFEVKATGEVQKVVMYDDYTKVSISKQDASTKKELSGAKLKLTTKDGTLIEEWTSAKEPYVINRLAPGDYVLIETKAPDGYKIAENISFKIKETGEVQKVVMYDEEKLYDITVSKVDAVSGDRIKGAKLKLVDSDGDVVDEWTSTTDKHEIEDLKPGKYIIVEVSAPDGYIKGTGVEIKVGNDVSDLDFKIANDYTKLKIYKLIKDTDKLLSGAKLHLEDEKGNIVAKWTSDDEAYEINHLEEGVYKLVEDEAPKGYKKADPITFKLKLTEKTQSIKMYDEADGSTTNTTVESNTTNNTKNETPTGDSAPILFYTGMMGASLIALFIFFKRKIFKK